MHAPRHASPKGSVPSVRCCKLWNIEQELDGVFLSFLMGTSAAVGRLV
jgi:hypothetical protein